MQRPFLLSVSDINVGSLISNKIRTVFGKNVSAEHKDIAKTIDDQRKIITQIKEYRDPNSINQYKIYLNYISQIANVLPLKGKDAAQFSFKSHFADRNMRCSDSDFEICGILFNIAALYSQAAFDEYLVEDNSEPRIRSIIQYFSLSAAYFNEIIQKYGNCLQNLKIGYDFQPTNLMIYYMMQIAQGQHMYYLLAITLKSNPMLISAVVNSCSKFYQELADLCLTSKLFPKDLGRHFQLQSYYTKLSAIHYYGLYMLTNERENSGKLFALARELHSLQEKTHQYMGTFHLEEADQQQGKKIFELVEGDRDRYYRIYRIYNGAVPESVTIPEGVKMEPATNLEEVQIPLNIKFPSNPKENQMLQAYRQRREDLISKCQEDGSVVYGEIRKKLQDHLLPEIFDDNILLSLPKTVCNALNSISQKGSVATLQALFDKAKYQSTVIHDRYIAFDEQNKGNGEVTDLLAWMTRTLACTDRDLADMEAKMGEVNANSSIFKKSTAELALTLPNCTGRLNTSVTLHKSTQQVIAQMQAYERLLTELKSDTTGEVIIRAELQKSKDAALLDETIIRKAMASLEETVKSISNNLANVKLYMESLMNEYATWENTNHMASDVKARFDGIRNIRRVVNFYEEIERTSNVVLDMLQRVDTEITNFSQQ